MRPIWSGSISFGLVNIPVKLYLAAHSDRASFRMLHKADQAPIQFRRFCSAEEKEVPYEEISRGFEFEKGQFVVIEDQDFERIERPSSRIVEVQQFVPREEVAPVFLETPYYLEPTKGAERAYALLREALRRSDRVGIGRVAFREREHLALVHGYGEALCLTTLRFSTEIREASGLAIPPAEMELPEKQLELALMLIDQLAAPFDPNAFPDTQAEQVQKMIQDKLAGMPVPKKAPARLPAQVVDLADVLQQSIDQARQQRQPRGGGAGEERGERRAPRQAAAREARRKGKKQ
ncbi:MAG TPA: Ku protein [Myxococcales bacterium]|jgi:DNA end-binding protein Ku